MVAISSVLALNEIIIYEGYGKRSFFFYGDPHAGNNLSLDWIALRKKTYTQMEIQCTGRAQIKLRKK